jgi:hypothetical protein
MKTKKNILFLIVLTLTVFSLQGMELKPDTVDTFFTENETPMQFSMNGIKDFFDARSVLKGRSEESTSKTAIFNKSFVTYLKEVYNKRGYAQSLSQDATPIINFLKVGEEISLNTETIYVGFRLYFNKIKSSECELIDETVLLQILQNLPSLLERHFSDSEEEKGDRINFNFIKNCTENIMLNAFTKNLPEFQQVPDVFLSNLSSSLSLSIKTELDRIETSKKKYQDKVEVTERLRHSVIRFLEMMLGKLIWNTQEYEGIWDSFIAISNGLQLLGSHSIINHMDDLDDLLWSLVHRFCYFLNLVGSSLPFSFYEEIETDLVNKVVYFLEAKEQDEGIKSKKEILLEAILYAKTKAVAYQQGIISE